MNVLLYVLYVQYVQYTVLLKTVLQHIFSNMLYFVLLLRHAQGFYPEYEYTSSLEVLVREPQLNET